MREGNRCYFADGAMTLEDGHATRLVEPPEDSTELLERQRAYVELRIKNLEGAFYEAQGDFHRQAEIVAKYPNNPGPPENFREILEGIKGQVAYWQEQLGIILAQLAETPDNKRERELQAANRADYEHRIRQAQEIRSIHL